MIKAPELSDLNDTPFDRYVVCVTNNIGIFLLSSYFYFAEDAYEEYDILKNNFLPGTVMIVLNEPGKLFGDNFQQCLDDETELGPLPIPEDRKWDIRDGCFPAVLFDEKGA